MKKTKAYQTLYQLNSESNAYMIEISLDEYSELFNGWDASSIKRKELEPELLDYLEQAGYEIPHKEKTEIIFYIPKDKRELDKESKSTDSIKNNFRVILYLIHKKLSTQYRQVFTYLTMSMLFITAATLLRNVINVQLLSSILVEGLFIGGWFMLWESFSTFIFDAHETRLRKNVFLRFMKTEILFKENRE
jgi:hypothetical protein